MATIRFPYKPPVFLKPVPSYTIKGKVIDTEMNPLPGRMIKVYAHKDIFALEKPTHSTFVDTALASLYSDESGEFEYTVESHLNVHLICLDTYAGTKDDALAGEVALTFVDIRHPDYPGGSLV